MNQNLFDKLKEDYLIKNMSSLETFYNEIEYLLKNKM